MNIFITGSEGFIGSHLTEKLLKAGHNLKCLVQYNFQNNYGWLDHLDKNIKKNIEIVTGDLRDTDLISKYVGKKTEAIFNLAALIGIPYSYIAPQSYIETNMMGTLNLLNAAKNLKNLNTIIQTSTSEVYGTPKKLPITENHALSAQSPYAASKIASDQLALSYYKSFNLPVSIIRPFNTYGPRQSLRAIIPTIITQIINKKIIKVGSIFPTRDFVHVSDTVLGFLKTLNCKKAIGEVINLGTGYEISIKNLISTISGIMRKEIKIISNSERKRPINSEVLRLKASNLKAKKILNWQPLYTGKSGLKNGLHETIEWYKNQINLLKFNINNFSI